MQGTVKWFNDAKGHGLIEIDDGDREILVEFSDICIEGFKTLERGERVEFEIDRSGGRLCAKEVEPVDRSGSRPLGPDRFV